MLKITKKSALVTISLLATLTIFGCGSNDSGSKIVVENNGKAASIQGLRELGDNTDIKNLSNSKIRSSTDKFSSPDETTTSSSEMCQSGSIEFSESNKNRDNQLFSFDAKNCNDGYSTIDGAFKIQMYKDGGGMFAEVLRELTVRDDYFSLFAKKGSFIKIINKQNNIVLTAGFDLTVDSEKFLAENLKIVVENSGNSGSIYIESGKMLIGEYYFEVDPSHNQKSTPIVMSDEQSGFLPGGVIKLLDGAGNKVEIAVVSKDELAFKIDENGDGQFSEDETLIESTKDFISYSDEP